MSWIKDRLGERTTVDGLVLVIAGGSFLILGPLATIAAYAAVAYGVFTIIKKG